MNYPPILNTIFQKIREYDRILLFRHIRMDGDCVGATKGLKELIKNTFPQKDVRIIDYQHSDFLSFLGPDDDSIPDEMYGEALGIVLDTGAPNRISNQKYTLCKELIKIDHHIEREPYGDYRWVEEKRSSCCEMIAAFYAAFRQEWHISPAAATYIYTGMITDSGRFQYEGVTGDTLRLAGLMLEQGVDTERLFAHLYLKDFESLKFKAYVYDHLQRTENGVAFLYIDRGVQEKFGLTLEDASAAISYMDSIRGCLCWLAFIENQDDTIRVRLRSRFAPINHIAEKYRGGGHANASGATVLNEQEMQSLLKEADEWIRHYKENHTGWM